jgi:hypothetical protein
MGLEDLGRWQWAGIGLIAGLAFGGVWSQIESDGSGYNTLNSQREFEQGVAYDQPDDGFRPGKIYDIVVHPKNKLGVVWVTFQKVGWGVTERIDGKPYASVHSYQFKAPEPFVPRVHQPKTSKPDLTVQEYLADLKASFPDAKIGYRYAWEEQTPVILAGSTVAGVVLLGGVWPSIVGLLTGAGIRGPRRKKKEQHYDLSRYGSGSDDAIKAGGPVVTDADKAQMAEMEEAMLAKLGNFGKAPDRDSDSVDEDAVTVTPLTGGPLEPDQIAAKGKESKEYKGDFYPVARPKHHE